jgi:hypothetical protein
VDAAIVTLSGLPSEAIDRRVASIALGGTIVANMALKIFVALLYGRTRSAGSVAVLSASAGVLLATLGWRLLLE